MKLAEALIERKALKNKMEDLKKRMYHNAQVQEGDAPVEQPLALFDELEAEAAKFQELVARINKTNNHTRLDEHGTLMEALIKRDMLHYKHLLATNLANKATPSADRYSQREIKFVATVDVVQMHKKADEYAKQHRLLDMKIQELNWTVELL